MNPSFGISAKAAHRAITAMVVKFLNTITLAVAPLYLLALLH